MNRGLSQYLDLVRLVAAMGVVLSHGHTFLFPALPYAVWGHGSECVAVFFVLSGFVIRFVSVEKNEAEWHDYAAARLARIWPVALLSMVVTFACTLIGNRFGTGTYHPHEGGSIGGETGDAIRAVLFLNEAWFTHSVFGTNEPYWSLGFEIPYYVLFGLLLFLSGRIRIVAILGWAAIYGPRILAYLPLWLLGVGLFELLRRYRHGPAQRMVGLGLMTIAALAYFLIRKAWHNGQASILNFESWRSLLIVDGYFTLVGLAFALSIVGASLISREGASLPASLARPIQWLAGGSFTLYLTHMPLMVLSLLVVPAVRERPRMALAMLLVILLTSYLLAELAERRKRAARRLIGRAMGRVMPGVTHRREGFTPDAQGGPHDAEPH